MKRSSPFRLPLILAAALFTLWSGAAQAGADAQLLDRSTLQAAEGGFVLADGRTLNLRVLSRSVEVSLNDERIERWRAESETVLVSPDRRHRLHLHRDVHGAVNSVSLESPRQR